MNIEHKLEPIEHWIVDGKAYRLATEADIGKDCYFSDAMLSRLKSGIDRCLHGKLTRFNEKSTDKYWSGGTCWMFALIQDDSLLTPPQATEPTTKPIDWTKPVRTKDGRAVRVLCTDGPGVYQVIGLVDGECRAWSWTLGGIQNTGTTGPCDLENVPQRIQREYWANIYSDGAGGLFETKKDADRVAGTERIACVPIPIDCEKGEGL